jgi:nicotinate-nucleotide pyrophosphorylase
MAASNITSPKLDEPTLTQLRDVITRALAEDVGSGDVTTESTVPVDSVSTATFLAKDDGVLSGLAAADEIFARVDGKLKVKQAIQMVTLCISPTVAKLTCFVNVLLAPLTSGELDCA